MAMVAPPSPFGLEITRTAKMIGRAFDDVLTAAGGSLPVWLVLVSIKSQRHGMQRDLADSVGVEGPTLTHHLNRLEAAGLVVRRRDPQNRRVHQVELTEKGDATFHKLRLVVTEFDRRLRAGMTANDIATMYELLERARNNVT